MDLDNSYWYVHSNDSIRRRIRQLLLSYKNVFTTPDQKVGLAKFGGPFRIEILPGSQPVKSRDLGLKPAQIESLKQQLKDWTADGVIKPSTSPWASPHVPVLKKDGSMQWAVDYRRLNQCTVPDSFPTHRIADVMDGLAGSRVFSTLDAAQAYHNVPIEPGSQDLGGGETPQTNTTCIKGTQRLWDST